MTVHLTETDMSAFEADLDRPPIHAYPADRRYRLSGAASPQVGDIARCGHVKAVIIPHLEGGALTCEGCRTLLRLAA